MWLKHPLSNACTVLEMGNNCLKLVPRFYLHVFFLKCDINQEKNNSLSVEAFSCTMHLLFPLQCTSSVSMSHLLIAQALSVMLTMLMNGAQYSYQDNSFNIHKQQMQNAFDLISELQ